MLLLISVDFDHSTQNVCKWLTFLKKEYILITESNKIQRINSKNLFTKDIEIETKLNKFNLKIISNVWFRRGCFFKKEDVLDQEFLFIEENLKEEWKVINDFFMDLFEVEDFFLKKPNKLIVLNKAPPLPHESFVWQVINKSLTLLKQDQQKL